MAGTEFAFPSEGPGRMPYKRGMTLRDYFACEALKVAIVMADKLYQNQETWEAEDYASEAYKITDEMLKQRL